MESLSSRKAEVVADPTMLLTREQWLEFASRSEKQVPSEPYIFCYFLGTREDIRQEAKKLAEKTGLKIVIMRHMDEYVPADETLGDYAPYDVNACDFVNLLRGAAYVCTDSFHGTVFSILMHRRFITFYRTKPTAGNSTHSRIDSLLNTFGLSSRIYRNDINPVLAEIDYDKVDQKLAEYREKSLAFFRDALALADK